MIFFASNGSSKRYQRFTSVPDLRPAQRVRTTSCMAMGYSTSGTINPLKGFFGLPNPAVPAGDRECEQEEALYFVKEYSVQEEQPGVVGTAGAVLHSRFCCCRYTRRVFSLPRH